MNNKLVINPGSLSSNLTKTDCLLLKQVSQKVAASKAHSQVFCNGVDSNNLARKIKVAKKRLSLKNIPAKIDFCLSENLNLSKVALTAGITVRKPTFSFKDMPLSLV